MEKLSCSLIAACLVINLLVIASNAERCKPNEFRYGESDIIDQLLVCSLTKTFDLDLTPRGDLKSTSKSLVEQGLSNKTSVLYAKLSGLWTAKRPSFVETGWRCDHNGTLITALIEVDGLALEVVERVETSFHRNQHKLAQHKPCKTFDLPIWMCRQTKPIFRTIKTWVNRAYFNLTLSQGHDAEKPKIDKISLMFTCPETFKQRITHSPSAMYLLSKYLDKPSAGARALDQQFDSMDSVPPPTAYSSTQDGRGPSLPPYHHSVNLILNQVTKRMHGAIGSCIHLTDSDLLMMSDYNSFTRQKFRNSQDYDQGFEHGLKNQCSNKIWLRRRLEIAEQASLLEIPYGSKPASAPYGKRGDYYMHFPDDPNELLDPHGHYFQEGGDELMIDDN